MRCEPARELDDGIFAEVGDEIGQCREQRGIGHLLGRHAALGPLVPGSKNEVQRLEG